LLGDARLEAPAADERVDQIVATISAAARTGQTGDGKIDVQAVENVVRIRTGEAD
jgi:nitrogen regulatory protein P-II 2